MCIEEQSTKPQKHLENFHTKTVHRFQFYSKLLKRKMTKTACVFVIVT